LAIEPTASVQSESVLFIETTPHNWLFPQVSAVVHHGGCGTTAAGLIAGKPSIICTFFGNQPFWGRQVESIGVGPPPIPQKRFTVEHLCRAIDVVMNDSAMRPLLHWATVSKRKTAYQCGRIHNSMDE